MTDKIKEEIIGKKFGKLTVIEKSNSYNYTCKKTGKQTRRARYIAKCDCGNHKQITGQELRNPRRILQCTACAYASRPQSTRRLSAWERIFKLKIVNSLKKRNIKLEISVDDFKEIASKNCYYCGAMPQKIEVYANKYSKSEVIAANGIDRVDSNAPYSPNNCVPCCWICNKMKSCLEVSKFFAHIFKIILNMNIKLLDFYPNGVYYFNKLSPDGLSKPKEKK